jgi:hypothetical protein
MIHLAGLDGRATGLADRQHVWALREMGSSAIEQGQMTTKFAASIKAHFR